MTYSAPRFGYGDERDGWGADEWLTNGLDEDEIVRILDEYVDDLAPLNREAFRPAARRIMARLKGVLS